MIGSLSPDGLYRWDGTQWIPLFELRRKRPHLPGWVHWLIPAGLVVLGFWYGSQVQGDRGHPAETCAVRRPRRIPASVEHTTAFLVGGRVPVEGGARPSTTPSSSRAIYQLGSMLLGRSHCFAHKVTSTVSASLLEIATTWNNAMFP
jgi:hypothetical protein